MPDSQKSHTQTRTTHHVSVAENVHSLKGISMPAVPVVQQVAEKDGEMSADHKSYYSLSGDTGDSPETKPVSAFTPVQKKQASVSPDNSITRFSPVQREQDTAQFKFEQNSKPIQFGKKDQGTEYDRLADGDEVDGEEDSGESILDKAKAIANKIVEAADKEAFLAIINGKLDGSGLEISEEGGLIIDGSYGISQDGASYTTDDGTSVGISAEGISLTGSSGSLKIGKSGIEAEFDDIGASISGEGASFKFAGQDIAINFANKEARYKFEQSFSIPDGGPEAEWVSVGLSFPVFPGLNVAGSIAVGGGAKLDLTGAVSVKKEGSPIAKYIGELNSNAEVNAGLFAKAKLGVETGVPLIATVGGGVSAKLSATPKATLKADVADIMKQADRWTTGGLKLKFKMEPTDIEGAVSLYIEAKLLGGLFSKEKEFPLASKKLASFKGYEFARDIGTGGTANIDMDALKAQMAAGDKLTPNAEANAMAVSLVQQLFALKVLKKYQAASDKVQIKKDKIKAGRSSAPQNLVKYERDQRTERSWIDENMDKDNDIKNLLKAKKARASDDSGDYRQLSDAPLIHDEITNELGTTVTTLITRLEAEFGATGKKLVDQLTPDNGERVIKVLREVGAIQVNISGRK